MGCTSSLDLISSEKVQEPTPKQELSAQLARGSFGEVQEASARWDNREPSHKVIQEGVSVKVIDIRDRRRLAGAAKDFLQDMNQQRVSLREVVAWSAAGKHPNVIALAGHTAEVGLSYMFMERGDKSLYEYLVQGAGSPALDETSLASALQQCLAAIGQVHASSIIHRDVKGSSFIVREDTVMLCDFGQAVVVSSGSECVGASGVPHYMAPEMLDKKPYGSKVDIWAFGVLAYACFFGGFPYTGATDSLKDVKASILSCKQTSFTPCATGLAAVSNDAVAFCRHLLDRSTKRRPTATAAMNLPFFKAQNQKSSANPPLVPNLEAANRSFVFGTFTKTQNPALEAKMKLWQRRPYSRSSRSPRTLSVELGVPSTSKAEKSGSSLQNLKAENTSSLESTATASTISESSTTS